MRIKKYLFSTSLSRFDAIVVGTGAGLLYTGDILQACVVVVIGASISWVMGRAK